MKKFSLIILLLCFSPTVSAMTVDKTKEKELENYKNFCENLKTADESFNETCIYFLKNIEESYGYKMHHKDSMQKDEIGEIAQEAVRDVCSFGKNILSLIWNIYSAPTNELLKEKK